MSKPTTLQLGPRLFQFGSFLDWVNHAQRAWARLSVRAADTICLDAKGRPCSIGRDFMKARDEDAFPVSVHLLRGDLPQYEHLNPPAVEEKPSFSYSYDEERFHGDFDSEAEALAEAFSSTDYVSCWVGEVCHPAEYFKALGVGTDIYDLFSERLGEEIGEVAECFTMKHVEREALGELVLNFIIEGPGFSCFGVKNVREVTREQFEALNGDSSTSDMFADQQEPTA